MKKQIYGIALVLFTTLTFSSQSLALVQWGAASGKEIKGAPLFESAKTDESPAAISLKRVTQGLRQKKIVFVWASVYVAQYFSNGEIDFSSTSKLKETLLKGPLVISMTFVRGVGIDKIVDGFKEVLKANGVDDTQAPFNGFVEAVKKSGDVNDKQTYFFVFKQEAGKESVTFETNGKEQFSVKDAAPGFQNQFLGLWLGKPVDSGLEQLQAQLLSKHID